MDKYKYRTQLYLDAEHYRFIKERAARYHVSMAEVIRQLIDKEIEGLEQDLDEDPIFRLASTGFDMGRGDGSHHHDPYIYGAPAADTGGERGGTD
ncbi:MAG: hypothetical protein D9V47_02750 [Clostridia bacterium]|nr:MAG: hypothetical protein D9V47_02750 [Clostridia bacterium]